MTLGNAAVARRRPAIETFNQVAGRLGDWADARLTWLSLAGSLAVVVLLYGRALTYAFFFDDTYDLTRTEGRSYLSLLTSSKDYSYDRPIPFLIWKLLRSVQGHYDQSTLHTLPLIAHALAGWLLFLLVRRLGAGAWALIPALLFLTFPFDYQAVPISGTLFHPLAGAAVLAALLAYQLARGERASRRRLALNVAALAATFVALWSHESGVVVAPLIVGLEALFLSRTNSRRPSPWALAHVLAMALFVFVWYSVEKAPSTESTNVSELHPKVLYLLQGFTYPFSAQLIWLDEHLGWTPGVLQIAMPAIAIGAGAYVVAGWRSGKRGKALASSLAVPGISLIVSLIAFMPALTRLSYAYVEDSPRLLYMVGIGAAVFWGLLPALDFHHSVATRIWRTVTLLLLAGVFLQSWRFVDVRMTMLARGSDVIAQVVAAGEQFRGEPVVFVNAPAWFSQNRYEYPLGHFGVQLMPSYIGLNRIIYASSSYSAYTDAASVSWNPDVSGGIYPFGPHGPSTPPEQLDALLRQGREVVDVRPEGSTFAVRDVGRLMSKRAEQRGDFPAEIASSVWISTARTASESDELVLLFQWHVISALTEDANAVIELRDADGRVVQRFEGYPLSGVSAPRLWVAGDRIDDSVAFPMPARGVYSIWAGMRSVDTDQPLPVTPGPEGAPVEFNMVEVGTFDSR